MKAIPDRQKDFLFCLSWTTLTETLPVNDFVKLSITSNGVSKTKPKVNDKIEQ